MKNMKYRIIRLAVAAFVVTAVSSCSVFRKGCKCPPVHRHTVASAVKQPEILLQRFGNGDRTHVGSSMVQQGAGTGFERSTGRQHIVNQ